MQVIKHHRLAKTPPLPEHMRCDGDCDWDSSDVILDDEGFNTVDYSAQGSLEESFWEIQARAILLSGSVES